MAQVEIWSREAGRKLADIPADKASQLFAAGDEIVIGRTVFRVVGRRHIVQSAPRTLVLVTDRIEAGGGGGGPVEPPVWPAEASTMP